MLGRVCSFLGLVWVLDCAASDVYIDKQFVAFFKCTNVCR